MYSKEKNKKWRESVKIEGGERCSIAGTWAVGNWSQEQRWLVEDEEEKNTWRE